MQKGCVGVVMKMDEFPEVTVWFLQQRLHFIIVDSPAGKKSQIILSEMCQLS